MTEDAEQEARELAAQVERHRALYASGVPELVDADYDALKDELPRWWPSIPSSSPPTARSTGPRPQLTRPTVRHARPMLSLAKATTEEQVDAFCARFPGQSFRVSEKLDGLSLSVVYEDGALDYVATRGTGDVGELVTDKVAPRHPGPAARGRRRRPRRGARRGRDAALDLATPTTTRTPTRSLTNPRSGAAGTLMQKDAAGGRRRRAAAALLRVRRRPRRRRDRRASRCGRLRGRPDGRLRRRRRGRSRRSTRSASGATRSTTTSTARSSGCTTPAAFEAAGFNARRAARRDRVQVPARGAHDEAAGGRRGRSARSAASPPRARVEPVFVGGVTVENITLHNPRLIRERDLRIGDTVAVVRRGDVIPFAGRAIVEDRDGSEQEIVPPTHCPSCGERARDPRHRRGALVREPAVPGAGDAAADALGLAARRPTWRASATSGSRSSPTTACSSGRSDFYALTAEQLIGYERMGEVSARQHASTRSSARKGLGLRRALIGLAIPMASDGVGQAAVPGRLRAHRGRHGRDRRASSWRSATSGRRSPSRSSPFFARAGGARGGRGAARARRRPRRARRGPPGRRRRGGRLAAEGRDRRRHRRVHRTRVTGAKISRPDLTRLVEQAGATAASSVSASTDYLLAGANVGAAKTDKATKLGVEVVDQDAAVGVAARRRA